MFKFRFNAAVLFFFSFTVISSYLSAQSPNDTELLKLQDVTTLDYYLDTADKQKLEQRWFDYAQFGILSVSSLWEKDVLLLMGEDFDFKDLKIEAHQRLNNIIDERFAQWLNKKFFNSVSAGALGELNTEIENLNKMYLFDIAPDGSVQYKTTENYDEEKLLWSQGGRVKISELIENWSDRMTTTFADLRSSFTDTDLRNKVESAGQQSFDSYKNAYTSQLYRLFQIEQSRFSRLRLYDQYSLQYESEKETAECITNELIEKTQAGLDTKLNTLTKGLDTAVGDVNTDGVLIDAGSWSSSFISLLEQGLQNWDDAEQQLLMERIQWEQRAGQEAAFGEEAWAEAFMQLREKRTEWMAAFRRTLEEGSVLWTEESLELERAIEKSIAEISNNIENSDASLEAEIDNLTGMLLQSVNMMKTARTSWEYWMDRFDEGEKDSFDSRGIDYDAEAMRECSAASRPDITDESRNDIDSYKEVLYWINMFKTYQDYARDSQNRLAETYGIVVFDDPSLLSAFDSGSLSNALLDMALLEDDNAWEAVYLDDFQVALLKARAYMQYWIKQKEIAQAVYDYALDNSSTKENAEVTSLRLKRAKLDYTEALDEYFILIDRLTDLDTDIEICTAEMEAVQQEIQSFQSRLSSARDTYKMIMTDLSVDNPQYLAEQYRENYVQLLDLFGMNGSDSESPGTALENYLLAASEYGLEQNISLVSRHIIDLVSGGENFDFENDFFNPETASLYELKTRYENTAAVDIYSAVKTGENTFIDFLNNKLMLSVADFRFDQMLEFYELYNSTESLSRDDIIYEMQTIAETLETECEIQYESRLAEIKLYTAEDFESWGMQYFGTGDYYEIISEKPSDSISRLKQAVSKDISVYNLIVDLYDSCSKGESFVISDLSSCTPESAMQKIWDYHRAGNPDDEAAAVELNALKQSLQQLLAWLDGFESIEEGLQEFEKAIVLPDSSLGQNFLGAYLDGYHNLGAGEHGDMYGRIFADEISDASMKASLLKILKSSDNAPALAQIQYEQNLTGLISFLAEEGMLNDTDKTFKSPEALWTSKNFTKISDVTSWFLQLNEKISALVLPSAIDGIFSDYINELKDYVSVRSAEVFDADDLFNINAINEYIGVQSVHINELNNLSVKLQGGCDDTEKLLRIAETAELTELKSEAERRLFETVGIDLALSAVKNNEFSDSNEGWEELFDDYCSTESTGLSVCDGFLDFKDGMLKRASELYQLSIALADYRTYDWQNEYNPETLSFYKAMLYNSLPFDSAESFITGPAGIDPVQIKSLYIIDSLLTSDAGDFPEDPELEWIYSGNDTLHEVDTAFKSRTPELWASDGFDFYAEVCSRYFSKPQLSELKDALTLSDEEVSAGITVGQKAVQLWNRDYRQNAVSGLKNTLRSFAVLVQINKSMTDSGEYTPLYGYSDILAELCAGLELDAEDLKLFSSAAGDFSSAVLEKVYSAAEEPSESLSGEELYWNLMIKARDEALSDNYNIENIRSSLIFDGNIERAEIISGWLHNSGSDYNAVRASVDAAFEELSQPLLYALKSGRIYADIFSFNLAYVLSSESGIDADEAVAFSRKISEKTGVETQLNSLNYKDFSLTPVDQKLDYLLNINEDAAFHQLKKELTSGVITSEQFSKKLDAVINPDKESLSELKQLADELSILKIYKPLLHGDFNNYLQERLSDKDQIRRLKEIYYRFMGSPDAVWDDVLFAGTFTDGLSPADVLKRIETLRTRDNNIVSANSVFINEALSVLNSCLYGDDSALIKQLSTALEQQNAAGRSQIYIKAVSTEGPDNWRSFLTEEYLQDEDGTSLVPSDYSVSGDYDYHRDLRIGGEDAPALQEFSEQYLFSGTGSDLKNIIFDAACSYLDKAAYLTKAVESWTAEKPVLSEEIRIFSDTLSSALNEESYGKLEELYFYKPDAAVENDYFSKRSKFYSIQSGISSLKDELNSLGTRRETLIRLSGMGDSEQIAALKPIIDDIAELENLISSADKNWQGLMDSDGGYRELENEYSEVYQQAKTALNRFEVSKHDYSIARAIHDYAAAGYLSIDDETYAVFEPDTNTEVSEKEGEDTSQISPVSAGITGGSIVAADVNITGLTDGESYRDNLIYNIKKISPSEQLKYIDSRLMRAAAAYNALSGIIDDNIENYSVYEKNGAYRALFDGYLKTFKESLVINKINHVLNQALARQERVVQDSLTDWNKALEESYASINYVDENDTSKVNETIADLYLSYNDAGWVDLEWNTDRSSKKSELEVYFNPEEGAENGHSYFENDLSRWLRNIKAMGNSEGSKQKFTTWAMAEKYEEYSILSTEQTDSVTDDFWRDYLYKNGDENLDREQARIILINEWTSANNTTENYSGEQKWMFNFYKLLRKSGAMNIGISTDDNLQLLADEQSIVIANEYMAEKYHQDANSLVIASIPVLAMAAVYYAAAASALAVPFGWIAAAILFAIAAGLTYGGVQLAGDGAMKHAAARQIEHEVVYKADEKINTFISSFFRDTSGVLEKEDVYKSEYNKLLAMRGENENTDELNDSERIKSLQNSTIQAFSKEDEDLHGLLVQAELVKEGGSDLDDRKALAVLFGSYQEQMSAGSKEESSDSSRFISALENEAQKLKQTKARELNNYLTASEGIARLQAEAEINYERTYQAYIKEETSLEEFKTAASEVWANPLFSTREHLLRLYEQQNLIAEMIMGSDRFNADVGSELLESQKILLCGNTQLKGIFDYRMDNYLEAKQSEMDILRLEMAEKRRLWISRMSAITAKGELEWNAGAIRINREYEQWLEQTKHSYNKQKAAWDDKYLDFYTDKEQWLDAVTIQSTNNGDNDILENFGDMTRSAIAAAGTDILVPEYNVLVNPDELLNSIIDFKLLGTLLDNSKNLTDSINDTKTIVFSACESNKFTNADSLQAIKDFQNQQNEEYSKHLAELEYSRLLENVIEAENRFIETVDNANEGIDKSINKTMRDDGYTRSGNRYQRNLITGATVSDYIYEAGYVSTYRFYKPENTDFSSELEDAEEEIKNMEAKGLRGLVARAMENIEKTIKRIFGAEGESGFEIVQNENQAEKEGGLLEWLANLGAADEKTSTGTRKVEQSPGLFGEYLGYAPEFYETADPQKNWNDDGQIKYEGDGQIGLIFGEYIFNKIREGSGWFEVNMPNYKKKLWDDTDSFIKAPSTADLTSLTVSVLTLGAGGVVSAGGSITTALAASAVTLGDDLALSAMDIGSGERTLLEGTIDFAKIAGNSLLNSLGAGFIKDLDISNLGGRVGIGAARQMYNNTTTSAINALSYDAINSWSYDGNAVYQGIFGVDSMAGLAGGAVQTLANEALGTLTEASWTPVEQAFYGSAVTLGGIGAGKAAEYTVHTAALLSQGGFKNIGETMNNAFDETGMSLNVLDIGSMMNMVSIAASSFTKKFDDSFMADWNTVSQNLRGTGLFALNMSSSGVNGQVTGGGTNIGSSLYNLGKGFTMDMAIRNYSEGHKASGEDLLKNGYAFGDQSFENTIWRLLAGRDSLIFDQAATAKAQTIYKESGREIHMNSQYAYAADEKMLSAVTVLQHEALRDGISSVLNKEETYRAVKAHTRMALALGNAYGFNYMAGDENLLTDVAAYMAAMGGDGVNAEAFREYVDNTYDSSADYWKLIENPDGSLTLHDDGRGGVFYTDENGEEHEIGHYVGGSRTGHLQTVTGLNLTDEEKSRLNAEMLVGLGSADIYSDGHFLDDRGNQISIDLTGEWSDRMGAALDYDRMFVDAWRNEGNMNTMIAQLHFMNVAEQYGADFTDRQKYLADKVGDAMDFSARFNAGTATEHLFSQTEIENAVGFGKNALCYGTVPINLYQLRDPSISLDMIGDAVLVANDRNIVLQDGTVDKYSMYLELLGQEFNSSQYLSQGSDFDNLQDYLKSDYTMADLAAYGYSKGKEHHTLYRNDYDIIDPYPYQLTWQKIEKYRYRGLEWVDF